MIKKLIYTLLVAGGIAVIALVLKGNKEKIDSRVKPTKLLAIPVNTEPVLRQVIQENLVMTGTTVAFKDIMVMSETQGRILSINAEVGQKIPKGHVIAVVDDELKVSQLQTAEANLEKSRKDLERFESLLKEKAATDYQVEGARLQVKLAEAQYTVAKRQVEDSKIKSPISGTVVAKMVDTGMMVAGGTPVLNLADLSSVKVRVNVPERDIYKLKLKQPVSVKVEALPNQNFQGSIYSISDKGDEAHTFMVEILVPNPSQMIKAGMFCSVDFMLRSERNAMLIPRKAIDGSLKQPVVYVAEGNRAVKRELTLGVEYGTMVEVVGGLKETDQVIVSGMSNLTENAEIEVIQ